jgi:hypothetical protein
MVNWATVTEKETVVEGAAGNEAAEVVKDELESWELAGTDFIKLLMVWLPIA